MKNKWLIASVLIVVLMGLCLASLFAAWQGIKMAQDIGLHFNLANWSVDQATAKSVEEKNLEVSGPVSLEVETYQGNITVKTGKAGQITVHAEKTAWGSTDAYAQVALKDMTIVIDQSGKAIKISVDQAMVADMAHLGSKGGRVDFTITVPAETAVTLNSTEGALSLSGTSGSAKLKTQSGNLTLIDVTGAITGYSSNGEITAKNIGTDDVIELSSEFGSISVDNAKGSRVTIKTSNGNLGQLKNIHVSGLLKVTSEFGDIQIVDAAANTAEINSSNGAINLEKVNVVGTITVKSDFGNLTLKGVDADSYTLNTQNGKISLDGARNVITAHSGFGSIEVLNAQDATIDLLSNNGAVTFSGSLGSGPHTISSDFGNVRVTLPKESALNLALKTSLGKIITSDFKITINGTVDSSHWDGIINGGGAVLTIKTQNGNITLESLK